MKLSVLMSVYFGETSFNLERSLKSIWIEQTRKPDQIVLVQDGPLTVELYDVISKWSIILGDKLTNVKLEKNFGLIIALNKGIECVTSDFVARMDSDDISAPNRFEKQMEFMKNHINIDISSGAIQEFNEKNPCINIRKYPSANIREYIVKASPLAHAASIMNMKIFREGGLRYDERYLLNEDIALWFDALRKGYTMSNIDDVIYYVYSDDNMIRRRSSIKARTEFRVWMRGIKDINGLVTWKYLYPISRYIMRMLPHNFIKSIYSSKIRTLFLNSKSAE